jgi:glutamate dehydrogenase (NAD(P)+)
VRAFASAIADVDDYIVGPDMGTDEACMAWVNDEIGRSVGLPRSMGGIPLDEIGATGLGLAAAVDVAQGFTNLKLDGARVAVQGFGAVGQHAARFLSQKGAVLVAATDSQGTLYDDAGIDVTALMGHKQSGKSVVTYPHGEKRDCDAVIDVECDVWIPAARPDVITGDNVGRLNTKVVVQGANIPATPQAEQTLHERGILCIPDFIANAGGVICAAVEYAGGTEREALQVIDEKVRNNTTEVLEQARSTNVPPRQAAVALAERRVREAMTFHRWM